MGTTTKYAVDIEYRLAGVERAIAKMNDLGGASKSLAKSMEWVKRAAVAVGTSFVFGKMKSALIDSNRELESMQIGMSAVLGMSLDLPFAKAEPIAARLVEHYRNIAKTSPGTASDFIEFNNLAMGAVMNAGGTLGQLKAITEGGVIAGKSFGLRGDVAGRDVQQALTGNVSAQTPLIKMLLGSEKKIAEFNKMSGQQRVAALQKAFESPALKDAAKKFGASYEGELSTLKDTAEGFGRAVGKPLFDQLTKWLHRINAWADNNQGKIAAFAKTIGEGLATGARWLVKGVGFLVEHKGVILAIAGSFAALKLAGGIGNSIKGGLGGFNLQLGLATAGLAGLVSIVTQVRAGWGDIKGLVYGDRFDPSMKNSNAEDQEYRYVYRQEMAKLQATKFLRDVGGNPMGDKEFGELELAARNMAFAAQRLLQVANHAPVREAERKAADAKRIAKDHDFYKELAAKKQAQKDNAAGKPLDPLRPKVNVTIKRVEVVADDADRFIHAIVGAVGKEISSPSQWSGMPRGNT